MATQTFTFFGHLAVKQEMGVANWRHRRVELVEIYDWHKSGTRTARAGVDRSGIVWQRFTADFGRKKRCPTSTSGQTGSGNMAKTVHFNSQPSTSYSTPIHFICLSATVSTIKTTSGFGETGSTLIWRRPTSETILDRSTGHYRTITAKFHPKNGVRWPFPPKPEVEIWRKPRRWTRSHRLPIRLCIHYGVYLDSFCQFVDDIVSIGPL